MIDADDLDEGGGDEGSPAWMATFSDLATLLLTFFVLMLSFANMDVVNFKTAMGSVKAAMGVQFEVSGDYEAMSTSPIELSPVEGGPHIPIADLVAAQRELKAVKKYIKDNGLEDQVEASAEPRGIAIRARDKILFAVGDATLLEGSAPTLKLVTDLFNKFRGQLSIEGHTDSRPITSSKYPSNWELSAARAMAVMRELQSSNGLPMERMHFSGYGETRPVAEGTDEASMSRNRRVEFVFEYPVEEGKLKTENIFDFDK